MKNRVDSENVKYAIIEALRSEGRRLCVAIAYPDEQSLRDLLAPRSIVAVGFTSREEAVASIENCCC
jgi:hypothetical protein